MTEFEQLLMENQSAVERYVRFKISSSSDAEDILQEVLFIAYKNFKQLKSKQSFKAWIIGIARNKCNDYFRKKARLFEIPIDDLKEIELTQTRFGYNESYVVSDALEKLSHKDKQILYLAYWKQFPQAEIAKLLDIPMGTVKSRLYTAKQNFKSEYPHRKDDMVMTKLPEKLPEYKIEKSDKKPFGVKWEELWGLFIIPKLGEKCSWGIYESDSLIKIEWGELEVVGLAEVHEVGGVEIIERRYNRSDNNIRETSHGYIAQLTDTYCRMLAESYEINGTKRFLTFLDDEFITNWGYGEDNFGKETDICPKGKIYEQKSELIAENRNQLFDIVGRYNISINGKVYDTIRIVSLDSYDGEYTASEQFVDKNGKTVLWRRFNQDDWGIERYKKKWSHQLPTNQRLIINGEIYVHWYDCITDYIF